jgi:purine-nucleoside phosphorylase
MPKRFISFSLRLTGSAVALTTDAPYRETTPAIARANKAEGILAGEMEAASLHAFAEAMRKSVVCLRISPIQCAVTKVISRGANETAAWLPCASLPIRSGV